MQTSLYQRYYTQCPKHATAPNADLTIRAMDVRIDLPQCPDCQRLTRQTIIDAHKHVIGRNDMTPALLCQRFKWRYQLPGGGMRYMHGDTPTAWAHRLEAWCAAAADWRHAASCDCLQCVTNRITADRREKISA